MRLIALASLASEVSLAGGLGFVGAGSDVSDLDSILHEVRDQLSQAGRGPKPTDPLPIGVGFLLWAGNELLSAALPIVAAHRPAAVWLFAPQSQDDPSALAQWADALRATATASVSTPKIWIQVGTVAEAVRAIRAARPDVLVVQGQDAGGHGLERAAGLVPLLPEVADAVTALCDAESCPRPVLVAAGGIVDGRGTAAALALGAAGVTMGTRFLAAPEANLATGYREAVLKAADGGVATARGKLYDRLRGTTSWPERYGGRGVLNQSWADAQEGMGFDENKQRYDEALGKGDEGWGEQARLATYAGTGVGLVREVQPAAEITRSVRTEARRIITAMQHQFGE